MRPVLVLLNGLPGAGKSTLARDWCAAHAADLPLALDVDVLRTMLGGWQEHLLDAGLAARSMAIEAARVRLLAGGDVLVPQFVRRPEFVDALESLAVQTGAAFLHARLDIDLAVAAERLATRGSEHEGALEQSLETLRIELAELLATRPAVADLAVEGAFAELDRLIGQIREPPAARGMIRFDHVGITVADLERASAFFTALGLEVEGGARMQGEFVDTVIGIAGSVSEIRTLRVPGGGGVVELSCFERPEHEPGSPDAMATELGLRNVCFEVSDLDGLLACLAVEGYGLVGGVGRYEDAWRMAYVRGQEGIVVALAERVR